MTKTVTPQGIVSMHLVHGLLLPLLLAVQTAGAATPTAVVVQINGAPTVERTGKTQPLQPGAALESGDAVLTDDQSKVRIILGDDSVLIVGPRSRLIIERLDLKPEGRNGRLQALAGSFKIAISKWLSGPTDYEIHTPTAVAGVRGTIVWGDIGLDSVCALDGKVEVRSRVGGAAANLNAGQCAQKMGIGSPVPLEPSPADLQKYLKAVTLE